MEFLSPLFLSTDQLKKDLFVSPSGNEREFPFSFAEPGLGCVCGWHSGGTFGGKYKKCGHGERVNESTWVCGGVSVGGALQRGRRAGESCLELVAPVGQKA